MYMLILLWSFVPADVAVVEVGGKKQKKSGIALR